MQRDRLWTIPNVVSLTRVALAALFVMTGSIAWRLTLVGVASTTDYLDGWIARRRGEQTRWGALIDAVSDRGFAIAAVATLAWEGTLGSAEVAVFLSRDLATALGLFAARRIRSLRNVTFIARFPGKVVTVLQFLALVIAIAAPRYMGPLILVLAIASTIAIVDYGQALWKGRARAA